MGLRVRVRDRLRVVAGARGWTRVRVRVRGLDGAHIQGVTRTILGGVWLGLGFGGAHAGRVFVRTRRGASLL